VRHGRRARLQRRELLRARGRRRALSRDAARGRDGLLDQPTCLRIRYGPRAGMRHGGDLRGGSLDDDPDPIRGRILHDDERAGLPGECCRRFAGIDVWGGVLAVRLPGCALRVRVPGRKSRRRLLDRCLSGPEDLAMRHEFRRLARLPCHPSEIGGVMLARE
jgi:hypothetical protein